MGKEGAPSLSPSPDHSSSLPNNITRTIVERTPSRFAFLAGNNAYRDGRVPLQREDFYGPVTPDQIRRAHTAQGQPIPDGTAQHQLRGILNHNK